MAPPRPLVSFLLPTRQRPRLVHECLQALASTARNPNQIEILFGIDDDDDASAEAAQASAQTFDLTARLVRFRRMGYGALHRYNNALARVSTGSWIAIWNDDVQMETVGWDAELARQGSAFACFDPGISNGLRQYRRGLFPVVPRAWLTTLGRLSPNPHCDTFMFHVGDVLGVRRPLAWSVRHNRFYETGLNNDATFRAGQPAYQTEEFYSDPAVVSAMNWDARRLARAQRLRAGTILRLRFRSDERERRVRPGQRPPTP